MGEGILHPLAALIVEAQHLIIGVAHLGHLLSAALAHADTMAPAAHSDAEAAVHRFHRPQLVLATVEGQ